MAAGFRATGSGFASIAKKLQRLASTGEQKMAEKGADAAQDVLDKQYADEAGPGGARWPAKKRPNGKPQGRASDDTMDSARAVSGPGAEILLSVEGASSFLQDGTVKMDPRPILPRGSLPADWSGPIDAAAVEGIHDAYEGR
jgi:hypothetical protein